MKYDRKKGVHFFTKDRVYYIPICDLNWFKRYTIFMGNPSQNYRPAIRDHTVLPATWTQVEAPSSTPGQHSSYIPWTGGRLSWPWWLVIYRDVLPVCRQSPIEVGNTKHLIMTRLGIKPMILWSQVQCPTVTLPSQDSAVLTG